ncbi:hypothetical protein DM02DRAFT_647730 [Periconia macrospinosa]|uniref:Uncharacterized protein n=1 Tax=Periconia macrospinosa TaxID=97972 RepID=A0A2V1ECU7_9PLEO|nr:hypothetical protein DM02DRAFT_647730 [Periconia macrospinosa]
MPSSRELSCTEQVGLSVMATNTVFLACFLPFAFQRRSFKPGTSGLRIMATATICWVAIFLYVWDLFQETPEANASGNPLWLAIFTAGRYYFRSHLLNDA